MRSVITPQAEVVLFLSLARVRCVSSIGKVNILSFILLSLLVN